MSDHTTKAGVTRRDALGTIGKAAVASVALPPVLRAAILPARQATGVAPVNGVAGVDRVVVLPGKTYLRGWAGYGEPPRSSPRRPAQADSTPPAPTGPTPTIRWTKRSGPGRVTFADTAALTTTATFSEPGVYVLALEAKN